MPSAEKPSCLSGVAQGSVETVLFVVGEQMGYDNLSHASRMNKAVVVFLKDERFVNKLLKSSLVINNELLLVSPLAVPSVRTTVSTPEASASGHCTRRG